jgi:predicted Zn-dependent protease
MGMEAEKPETYLGSAARHLSQGEVAAALATITQGLARHPDDPALRGRQADISATQPVLRIQAADLSRRLLAERPGSLALKNKIVV